MADQPSLTGPLARLDRADELTLQLTAACKAFLATRPYTIEERPDENRGRPCVRRHVQPTTPVGFPRSASIRSGKRGRFWMDRPLILQAVDEGQDVRQIDAI